MIFHNLIGDSAKDAKNPDQGQPLNDDEVEKSKTDRVKKDKVVVMQGPLSTIYTDALNKVYAQESQAIDAVTLVNSAQQIETTPPDLYVYVSDVKQIENSGVTEVFNNLRLALDNRSGNKVVVLESNGAVSSKMSLIDNYARSQGAKVVYSRSVALNTIKTCLENMRG